MQLTGSVSHRFERRRRVDEAWQRYLQDGVVPQGLGEGISESWRRVRESYRIDPALTRPVRSLPADALAERCRRDDVLLLAAPILHDFSDRLGLTDHVLAYFDGDGWMLQIDGDSRTIQRIDEQISFRPGANWSEESAGTNGPGTTLASGRPIEVFASEHFVAAWQSWSCAAAPVHAPGVPKPVGLVDITGPWELQSCQALPLAKAIARAIEERLRAATNVRDEVVRHAFRAAHAGGDALVALDGHGRVIAFNDAATRRRIVDDGGLPPMLRDALTVALRDQPSPSEGEVFLESPDGPAIASTVHYEGLSVGAIVRVSTSNGAPRPVRARGLPSARYDFGRILGRSAPLRQAVDLARTAARNDLPVVLTGESGTGKELFAQSIHSASGRQAGAFVAVNCGCIPSQLVEAELFGYEAGTFTGAKRGGNPGRFEDAHGGTLFLDEVSELPLAAQTALLRVLQEREVVRLGGSTPRPIDVRVVAATNKPLDEEVRARRFRSDLYYRLNVLSISVPPLRERGDDIVLLAEAMLSDAERDVGRRNLTLDGDAIDALRAHRWPGNVRELKNVILRAAATAPRAVITGRDLVLESSGSEFANGGSLTTGGELRDAVLELERSTLVAALDSCAWNFARTAHQLGISRMTLYRRARKYGISRSAESR